MYVRTHTSVLYTCIQAHIVYTVFFWPLNHILFNPPRFISHVALPFFYITQQRQQEKKNKTTTQYCNQTKKTQEKKSQSRTHHLSNGIKTDVMYYVI